MINTILFSLYNGLTFIIIILIKTINLIIRSKKIHARTISNRSLISYNITQSIWIHCASLGETISTSRLLLELNKKYPHYKIILTSHTLVSKKFIENKLPNIVEHRYAPYDNVKVIQAFINLLKPKLAIWIDQEFLPAALITLKRNQIPVILLNARMSDKSYKLWSKIPSVAKYLLATFSIIVASSIEDQHKYEVLYNKKVLYVGNLKNTVDINLTYDHELATKMQTYFHQDFIFTAVSTHDNEEDIICRIHKEIATHNDHFITLIIPRHIERSSKIKNLFKEHYNIHVPLLSECSFNLNAVLDKKDKLIIVDKIAKVSTFLSISHIAFIGKSLSNKYYGGHNLYEAVNASCPVIFGPNVANFQEQANNILANQAGIQVHSAVQLQESIINLIQEPNKLIQLKQNCRNIIKTTDKDITLFMNIIEPFLENQ